MSVEVEKLPTIGKAESIKTAKQGRKLSMRHYNDINDQLIVRKSNQGMLGKKHYRTDGIETVIANAKRILNFDKAFQREKEIAQHFLTLVEDESYTINHIRTIQKINKKLSLTYKDY